MKTIRLIAALIVFVPAGALFGSVGWGGDWYGWAVGGLIGVGAGLVFGGDPDWKVWDSILGPREEAEDDRPGSQVG